MSNFFHWHNQAEKYSLEAMSPTWALQPYGKYSSGSLDVEFLQAFWLLFNWNHIKFKSEIKPLGKPYSSHRNKRHWE